MIQGKWIAPGEDLGAVLPIRAEALGLPLDAGDAMSWNAVIYAEEVPCATGRIRYHEGDFLLEYICVLPAYRGQGIGDLLTRLLLFKAQHHSARVIKIVCDKAHYPFFCRYGFKPQADGTMLLMGSDMELDGCKGCGKCTRRKKR